MKSASEIERLAKKIRFSPNAAADERILASAEAALEKSIKTKPAALQPNIWRIIMKSRITKIAAAAIIIIAILIGINQFGGSIDIATPAYAIEQTLEANRSLRYLHFKMFNASHDEDAKEAWIEFDENGDVKNLRVNFPKWISGGQRMVWRQGKTQVWDRKKNTLDFFEDEIYTAKVLMFAQRQNPRGAVEYLYELQAEGKVKVEINEPSDKPETIVVTATYLPNTFLLEGAYPEMRQVLFVDRGTKLVTAIETYELKDGSYEYISVDEYDEYNKPFDPNIFCLEDEVPDDVKRIDLMTLDIGLEQGELTDREIAIKVARDFFEALIAKDYAKAIKIHGYAHPDFKAKMQNNFEKLNVLRIVSIGEPVLHGRPPSLRIPCTIEVKKDGEISQSQLDLLVHRVYGQPDRWNIIGGF